jgi:hypothetical protein
MATNPFAGAGLGAFGTDLKEAQAGASNEFAVNQAESKRNIAQGQRGVVTQMLASLIPGSAQFLGIKPPQSSPTPVAPVSANGGVAPYEDMQMIPSEMFGPSADESHPDLIKRLFESRNNWGL